MYVKLGCKNPVGYCKLHKATLSRKQMKLKQCVGKNCKHLVKVLEHPFWKHVAAKIAKQEEKKRKKAENMLTEPPQ